MNMNMRMSLCYETKRKFQKMDFSRSSFDNICYFFVPAVTNF